MKKLAAIAICLLATNANANLITNGDFSTLDITGWTLTGGEYSSASEGFFREFDNSGWAVLSQNITTTSGNQYDLSFDTFASQIGGNEFAWSVDNGATLNYITTTTSWVTNTDMFTAVDGTTNVAFYMATNSGTGTWRLDNVSVTGAVAAVSEPGSLALFGLGLAGIGFMRKKKAA